MHILNSDKEVRVEKAFVGVSQLLRKIVGIIQGVSSSPWAGKLRRVERLYSPEHPVTSAVLTAGII
jgi:hypothetical protein